MGNSATLHVKVDPRVAEQLEKISRSRGQSVSELVRQAISASYQTDLLDLTVVQRQALEAYRGHYISLGKLAEKMRQHILQLRTWLKEHGIPENSCFGDGDTNNAR